jgi:hypothetical protein
VPDHLVGDVALDFQVRRFRQVLRRDDDRIHPHRLAEGIFNRHLALAVRKEVPDLPILADLGEPAGDLVGERDGKRHQLWRLVAGVANHHALVAGAGLVVGVAPVGERTILQGLVDALGDLRALLLDRDDDARGGGVEPVVGVRIPDVANHSTRDPVDVDVGGGRDLTEHEHHASGGRCLARDPPQGIFGQDGIQHRV